MPLTPVLLGPVAFQDFEVPERIGFGGAQRLVIHRLPGGSRVIDALGRDDGDLGWSGVFSGPDAADRARLLDELRVEGSSLLLSWDAFLYTVIIRRFNPVYASPWWIPYRIACTVVQDQAQSVVVAAVDLLSSVTADLTAAALGSDVSSAQAAVVVPGATIPGTTANTSAIAALASERSTLETNLGDAGAGLQSSILSTVVASAGQLASLAGARGYLARAQVNLANAEP